MKFFTYLIISVWFSFTAKTQETSLGEIKKYFDNINIFESEFYHIENNEISIGNLYFNESRIRVEYTSPQNLLFVLKDKKVMYFNKDLNEVQYFNPKNTPAQILIDIFNKINFFNDFHIVKKQNYLFIQKQILIEKKIHKLQIYFETNPINLRKIKISGEISNFEFALININLNPDLDESIFSLANPLLW